MEPLPRWEVATNCQSMPYPSMSTLDVATAVQNGYRLACPLLCPEQVFAVMASCWRNREQRPSFTQLHIVLNDMQVVNDDNSTLEAQVLHHVTSGLVGTASTTSPVPIPCAIIGYNATEHIAPATDSSTTASVANLCHLGPTQPLPANAPAELLSDGKRPATARRVLRLAPADYQAERKRIVEHRDYRRLTLL